MIVPKYEQQVGIQEGGTITPKLTGLPESASGVNVAESGARTGQVVEQGADRIGNVLAYKSYLDSQEKAYDTVANVAKDFEEHAKGDGGWLTRQGANAKGITHGEDDKVIDSESFEGWMNKAKSEALKDKSPLEQKLITRVLDSHGTVWRNAIINHETTQRGVARDQAVVNQIGAMKATAESASSVEDLQDIINDAQKINGKHLSEVKGENDPEVLKAHDQSLAADFTSAAVHSHLESDPEMANKILQGMKGDLNPVDSEKLAQVVDGKMLDLRRNATWDQVKGMRHSDGTSDISRMESAAAKLVDTEHIPPAQRQHVVDFVKQQASVSDAALHDARQAQSRDFYNEAIKLRNSGVPFEQAQDQLFKKKGYGFDEKDRDDKTRELTDLYTTKGHDFLGKAEKAQTEDQKLMWKQIDDLATGKYGKKKTITDETSGVQVNMKDAFMIQMKKKLMGQPPEQMWTQAQEALKNVVVEPGHLWDTKKAAWEIDRDVDNMHHEQRAALENQYGGPLVTQAHGYLKDQGIANPTPKQIKTLIERMPNRGR